VTGARAAAAAVLLASLAAARAPDAKPAAAAAPAQRAIPVTAAALVGRWGDNGDCRRLVVFRADGTFRSYTGGEGIWRLAGNRLTMTGANGSFVRVVERIDRVRLRLTGPNGVAGVSQRC